MHPEMASGLAAQHRHDMSTRALAAGRSRAAASPRGPLRLLPRYRLSWSRTTLTPAAGGGRRGRSVVIIISATRGL